MRVCPYCNASNPDDSVFCAVCGKSFAAPEAPPQQQFPPQPPAYPPQQDFAPPPAYPPQQDFAPQPSYPPQGPPVPQYGAPQPQVPPYGGGAGVPPAPFVPGDPTKNWMGILAMIVGILSILICCVWYLSLILGGAGLIFGILGRKSQKKGMATAGMITGIIGLSIALIVVIFVVAAVASLPGWLDSLYDQVNVFKVSSFVTKG